MAPGGGRKYQPDPDTISPRESERGPFYMYKLQWQFYLFKTYCAASAAAVRLYKNKLNEVVSAAELPFLKNKKLIFTLESVWLLLHSLRGRGSSGGEEGLKRTN